MRVFFKNLESGGASTLVLALAACNPAPSTMDTGTLETTTDISGDGDGDGDGDPSGDGDGDPSGDGDGDGDPGDGDGDDACPPGGCLDMGGDLPPPNPCTVGEDCDALDILIVIDNSPSMVEEQLNIAENLAPLLGTIQGVADDVHIMITSTDNGHPHCATPPGYQPLKGAPQTVPCINRLTQFQGPGDVSVTEACESICPVAVGMEDPFIAFWPGGTNANNDDYLAAMRCIGPQGIAGCQHASPLEAMYLATDPEAAWNTAPNPFIRDGARLAVLVISDNPDCSVRAPEGFAFFTNPMMNVFWEINPDSGTKNQSTPAVCWNGSVNCEAPNGGIYPNCTAIDAGVLHPISRYITRLQDDLSVDYPKEVIFLGVLGVPPVTQHNPDPPYQPTAGGVDALVYRQWVNDVYPMGDLLPDAPLDGPHLEWKFGIGPGCTGEDGMGGFIGQALPSVRVKDVCQALDGNGEVRCCIESICDANFVNVIDCLTPI
jgi:hypothetical protein